MEYGFIVVGLILGGVIGYLIGKRNTSEKGDQLSLDEVEEKYVLRPLYSTLENQLSELKSEREKDDEERLILAQK